MDTTSKPNEGSDRPWARQSNTTAALSQAVCAVMASVGSVAKGSTNTFHKYSYASDADLLFAIQPEMATHGLHWRPVWIQREHIEVSGKNKYVTRIDAVFRLHHTSGEWMDYAMAGEGADAADKGVYKALTGTYKYLQRQAFAIPTGDNPEKDRRKPRESAQQKRKRQAKHDDAWDKERAWFHAAIRGHLWDHDTLWAECERGKGASSGRRSPTRRRGAQRSATNLCRG